MLAPLGKILIVSGLLLAAVGLFLVLGGKIGWIGRLPGDIVIRRGNFSFYFPLVTCLLLSVVLSLILWFFGRK